MVKRGYQASSRLSNVKKTIVRTQLSFQLSTQGFGSACIVPPLRQLLRCSRHVIAISRIKEPIDKLHARRLETLFTLVQTVAHRGHVGIGVCQRIARFE